MKTGYILRRVIKFVPRESKQKCFFGNKVSIATNFIKLHRIGPLWLRMNNSKFLDVVGNHNQNLAI